MLAVDGRGPGLVQELPAGDLGAMAERSGRDCVRDNQPGGGQDGTEEESQAKAEVRL